MEAREFDELAGRIEGVGRALLHLCAELEMSKLIDGPRLSQAWQDALPANGLPALETARRSLQELARALDDARRTRQ